jgi:hypothetical protein
MLKHLGAAGLEEILLLLETVEASHGSCHGLVGHASFQAEAILFFLKRLLVTGGRTRDITVAGI